MELIHIALAFDEAYAPHGAAAIASVLKNSDPLDAFQFWIIDNGLSFSTRERLKRLAEDANSSVKFIQTDSKRFSRFITSQYSASAYSRLMLAEHLNDVDQVLYLDSDAIVLKSVRPLWENRLGGMAAAVVRDAADLFGGHFLQHKQSLGLHLHQSSFNSGVMLINLDLWRRDSLTTQITAWVLKNADLLTFADQDALNAVLKDQVLFVNPKWNVQAPLIRAVRYGWINNPEWVIAVRDPAIIHYTTSAKPWNFACAVPRRSDYYRFARRNAIAPVKYVPNLADLFQRVRAEAIEFRWWVAALVKRRLRSLS